eukprot:CAMPEP_0115340556 /NCGR_PEP_ID=MMETSP0270-20121206/91209_1 /TAXON_ID=71861 /ORGANISM="Scrippsiella trochoidea, Strain CCMP3099" /LENGTH=41 /DNA_ID= /DNA_START= /DNA_END= /DNA_ORIENTATION=
MTGRTRTDESGEFKDGVPLNCLPSRGAARQQRRASNYGTAA